MKQTLLIVAVAFCLLPSIGSSQSNGHQYMSDKGIGALFPESPIVDNTPGKVSATFNTDTLVFSITSLETRARIAPTNDHVAYQEFLEGFIDELPKSTIRSSQIDHVGAVYFLDVEMNLNHDFSLFTKLQARFIPFESGIVCLMAIFNPEEGEYVQSFFNSMIVEEGLDNSDLKSRDFLFGEWSYLLLIAVCIGIALLYRAWNNKRNLTATETQ